LPRIFDNIDDNLGPHLADTVSQYDRLDAAVGYFNLRGWSTFADLVGAKPLNGDVPVARVLVGMTTADPHQQVSRHLQAALEERNGEDEIDRTLARTRREHAIRMFRTQLMSGLPTEKDLRALQQLRNHLDEGRVEIKLFTRRPLHGKTYIVHKEDINFPRIGFVGSSNLTMAGLNHNYELNVDVVDHDAAKKLAGWFEARWTDNFTIDITEDLIELINESWATDQLLDPYLVYLKVCFLLSKDAREGLMEYSLPASIQDQLLEYQESAVKTLARRIVNRGGAMLGDVVGLGKTITAIAVALMLREDHGYTTLVVCPKNLVQMWQDYLDEYEVIGKVVPYSLVHRLLPEIKRYQLVIVDESHTVRNSETIAHQAIADYIRSNDAKALLLTATPYNKRYLDVANQLALYIDPDHDLGLAPMEALRKDVRLLDKVDGKITTLGAFARSDEPEDWKRLMSEHLVRRTRTFIRENYAEKDEEGREYLTFANGDKFFFPDRFAKPLSHSFGDKDPARMMIDDQTLDAINGLRLPRYHLADYVRDGVEAQDDDGEVLANLQRSSGNLIGFTRTSLFKRLSSCGHSFIVSLARHLDRNRMYLYALDHGLNLPVGSVLQHQINPDSDRDLDEDDELDATSPEQQYDTLRAKSPRAVKWVAPGLFTTDLRAALQADTAALAAMLERFGPWIHTADSKIDALVDLLTSTHADEKVLIFSEYKDTVEYVADALKQRGVDAIEGVSGATSDPTKVARRFAPVSSKRLHGPSIENELQRLVTTDVLSEGQNLQDAHIVVNYDLPWAIIRLIQRAGRVDRVGQESEEVLIYTFLPDENVEAVLNLRGRIRKRLEENATVFDSDESFFGDEQEHAQIKGLYSGKLAEEEEGEVDAASYAYQVWQRAEKENPDLADKARALPDLVNSTKAKRTPVDPEGVVVYIRTERGLDAFGHIAGDDQRLLTGMEALRHLYAEPDTGGLPRSSDHFERVASMIRGELKRPEVVQGRLRGIRKRVWNRLNGSFSTLEVDVEAALEALYTTPLTKEAEGKLRAALRDRSNEDLADLLAVMHGDGRLVLPETPGGDPLRIVCSMETIQP
jgi:superfamily II DNA or RNA helicase